jgi:hypothetical protein
MLQEAIGKFSKWAERYLKAEQDASTITVPLYHYTDGLGLKGILESGRVWFTDYRHLNDPSELKHGIDMAHDVARRLGTGADGPVRLFLERFTDLFRHDNFAATLGFFIACFSRARDDLGQWRAYADNGRGFAIGFAPRMFRISELLPDRLPEFVGPVRYKIGETCGRHAVALEEAVSCRRSRSTRGAPSRASHPIRSQRKMKLTLSCGSTILRNRPRKKCSEKLPLSFGRRIKGKNSPTYSGIRSRPSPCGMKPI